MEFPFTPQNEWLPLPSQIAVKLDLRDRLSNRLSDKLEQLSASLLQDAKKILDEGTTTNPAILQEAIDKMTLMPETTNTKIYTCTYHGCAERFDTLTKLQQHKHEGHRNSITMMNDGEDGGIVLVTQRNSKQLVVQQRGIKVLINNRVRSAFGDTGAGQNVISDRYYRELKLKMRPNPKAFPMGNSKKLFSPGTVEVPLAFQDDPTNIITIVAHVVRTFAYDLILGNPFLRATQCLTKYIKRFVPCLFSLKSRWSFHLLGQTTERFQAKLGNGISFLGLPDIGSVRNVMDFGWAKAQSQNKDFKILSQPKNRGWILFPDGTEEATMGQAHTNVTLPDGHTVPIIFELLPNCHVPVVLGQDFIFEHDIYTNHASSLMNVAGNGFGDELMPMGYRWHRSESKKLKLGLKFLEKTQGDELERQMEWNFKYIHGRIAPVDEWNREHARRESYERRQDPSWLLDSSISLIEHKTIVGDRNHLQTGLDTQNPAQLTRHARANLMVRGTGDETASSHEGENSTHEDSSSTFLNSAILSGGKAGDRAGSWHGNAYFDDYLVNDEIAQWQAERPL